MFKLLILCLLFVTVSTFHSYKLEEGANFDDYQTCALAQNLMKNLPKTLTRNLPFAATNMEAVLRNDVATVIKSR